MKKALARELDDDDHNERTGFDVQLQCCVRAYLHKKGKVVSSPRVCKETEAGERRLVGCMEYNIQ